jgi:hypothetical protein
VTKQNLVKIQNQLESQINDREAILADVISGKGMQDIIKIEDITDADGDVIGKRMYTNDGVFRYDVDEDGNIIESSKTEESSGGGKSPNTPTETRPSPDTTTPEETGLQQTSRGMPKAGISDVSVIAPMVTTVPTVKIGKNGEVAKPSTKTQTTTTKPLEVPLKQPATIPSKTPSKTQIEVPQKINNPAINPAINPQTQTPVITPSKTPSKTTVVSPAVSPSTVQQQSQSQVKGVQPIQQQQMSKAQQMSQKTVTPTQIKTDTITNTNTKIITPPVVPDLPNDEGGTKRNSIPRNAFGTVTWKQGFGWYARWYPYRQQDSTFVKNQPKGATQIANAHSAYDTIQTLTGMPPSKVPQFDMGIEEVGIKAPPHNPTIQNRASISFQRNSLARGRKRNVPNDLGGGIVETRTKQGVRRHLRLT